MIGLVWQASGKGVVEKDANVEVWPWKAGKVCLEESCLHPESGRATQKSKGDSDYLLVVKSWQGRLLTLVDGASLRPRHPHCIQPKNA